MAGEQFFPRARNALAKEVVELRRRLRDRENGGAAAATTMTNADHLRQIMESAIDYAIIGMDLKGLVTSWNEGARRVLGWNENEMIGRPASVFFTEEDRQDSILESEMQAALRHQRGSDERWHVRSDGTRFWANGEMMPLKDEAGSAQGFVKILRDRTEQRLTAERQRADAEFLSSVLASSADCIKVLDLDARLIFMSKSGQRLMEVSDFDVIRGCPWPEFWQGPLRQAALDAVAVAKAGGTGQFQGLGHTMLDTPRYWDVQVTSILGSDGRPERLLVVSRDITAAHRVTAQRAVLLELGDRLRDVEDHDAMVAVAVDILARALNAQSAGYATDSRGRCTVTREWTAAGVTGTPALPPLRDHLRALQRNQPLVLGAEADSSGSVVLLPDPQASLPAALFFLTFPPGSTLPPEELVFVKDLADRAHAALAHRRSEHRVRDLAASLERQVNERTRERDRIWRVSRDLLGVATASGVWISINPAWTATLGWPEAEIVGQTYEWLTHPDDLSPARVAFAALTAGHRTTHIETRLRTVNGDYRWFSWSAVPVDDLLYCVGRDVTADRQHAEVLRKTEDQLRQSQKMEAVGQLTGGLAHDFNNLLTGISGSLELLKMRMAQGRTQQVERYIAAAEQATARAAALTHRLLAFSRHQTLEPKPIQPNRLIAGMKDLIQRTVGPEIAVETILLSELWNTLCDPNQLENAILNLAINARDAMPDGGRLVIETANLVVTDADAAQHDMTPGSYVTLSVTDTGVGMAPEVVARAFDPFFTTKPQGQGTGLGLSMIYGFARQSGGQARIVSSLGQGTTVWLYLPRHLGEEAPMLPADRAPATPARDGETVLVVEDEPTVLMLITDLLRELGYHVIEAADGNVGLAYLESDARIDLLITDVGLPGGINGRRLAEAGRARRADLKVLFVTGYSEDAATGPGQLQPGMAVLPKPFAMDALADRIKTLIGSE